MQMSLEIFHIVYYYASLCMYKQSYNYPQLYPTLTAFDQNMSMGKTACACSGQMACTKFSHFCPSYDHQESRDHQSLYQGVFKGGESVCNVRFGSFLCIRHELQNATRFSYKRPFSRALFRFLHGLQVSRPLANLHYHLGGVLKGFHRIGMAIFHWRQLLEGQEEVFMHAPVEHFPLVLAHIRGIVNAIGIW